MPGFLSLTVELVIKFKRKTFFSLAKMWMKKGVSFIDRRNYTKKEWTKCQSFIESRIIKN